MKNFIKKLFSLVLVGVVTVSMFSFIRPNRVDAIEESNASGGNLGIFIIEMIRNGLYEINYSVICYNAFGREIYRVEDEVTLLVRSKKIAFEIPSATSKMSSKITIPYSKKYAIEQTDIYVKNGDPILPDETSVYMQISKPGLTGPDDVGAFNGWGGTEHFITKKVKSD